MDTFRYAFNPYGKNKQWNFETLAVNFCDIEGTLNDVVQRVKKGHALCAGLLNGQRRAKANVIGSQWVLLDIDNSKGATDEQGNPVDDQGRPIRIGKHFVDVEGNVIDESDGRKQAKVYHHQMTIDEAIAHPFIKKYCALIYTSASHTEDWHKFRLVFLLPQFVEGSDTIEVLVRYLMEHLPHDPSCKDASRVFYGNTNAEFPLINESAVLPLEWIAEAKIAAAQEKLDQERRLEVALNRREEIQALAGRQGWDLDALVEGALSYIPPRAKGTGNYDECRQVLMALHSHYGMGAIAIAERWSPSEKGWNIPAKMKGFRRSGVTIGSLFHIARQYGFKFPAIDRAKEPALAINDEPPIDQAERKERAKELRLKRSKQLLKLTRKPAVRLNQRYLGKLPDLKPGHILAVSSSVGTGKTEALKGAIAEHLAKHPDALVIFIGSRNTLLFQTEDRTGIPHIQTLDRQYPGNLSFGLKQTKGVLICLDSIERIPWNSLPANSLIVLDEGESLILHGLGGGTLGDRQQSVLNCFRSALVRTLSTNGSVIVLEDNLTDLALNFYETITGGQFPVEIVVNDWKMTRTAKLSVSGRTGHVAAILGKLKSGSKAAVPTDSQVFAETLEIVVKWIMPDIKILRHDSKTVERPENKAFQKDPNRYLIQNEIQLLILSPTAESGVSIDVEGFDVYAYLVAADTRRQHQLLHRIRNPRSIQIETKVRGFVADHDWETCPNAILKQQAIRTKQTAMLSGINAELTELSGWSSEGPQAIAKLQQTLDGEDADAALWAEQRAIFKGRENLLKDGMQPNLQWYLVQHGYEIQEVLRPQDAAIGLTPLKSLLKQAKELIEATDAKLLYESKGGLTEAQAIAVLSSPSSTYKQRKNAERSLLEHRYPGAHLTESFLLEVAVKDRGALGRAATLSWMTRHPHIAAKIDRGNLRSQLSKGWVAQWKLTHYAQKISILNSLGLQALIDLVDSDELLSEESAAVQAVKVAALQYQSEIYRYFRLSVKEDQSAIHIADKLLRKCGYDLVKDSRVGGRGEQSWRYRVNSILSLEHRMEIEKALDRKWAKDLEAVVPICNKQNVSMQMGTTEADPPPDPVPINTLEIGSRVIFLGDRSQCRVKKVEGNIIWLQRIGTPTRTVDFCAELAQLEVVA
ncbi:MAG TPA: plasmid replication protein, CyRepA1 family [Stenomitos sp.]